MLKKIRLKGGFTREEIKEAVENIRKILLEADVAVEAVDAFAEILITKINLENPNVKVSPGDYIVKIVFDSLVEILGGDPNNDDGNAGGRLGVTTDLAKEFASVMGTDATGIGVSSLKRPSKEIIMLVGLQGAGKTTTAAKLGLWLNKNFSKKVLLVSVDVYRPAAREQLKILGKQVNLDVFAPQDEKEPLSILEQALQMNVDYDALIIDTAGRLETDDKMMAELVSVKKMVKPTEIIYVLDAMVGQSASIVAKEFKAQVGFDSIAITRLDSDSRGGGAFSVKVVTGVPIKYAGKGEKINDFSVFDPKGLANSLLGMGDLQSLLEKVNDAVAPEEAEDMMQRIDKGNFDMNDLLKQLRSIKKMGSIASIMSMIPGMGGMLDKVNAVAGEDKIKSAAAIICSMTLKERKNPTIIDRSRLKRIAKGSGTKEEEIKQLLTTYGSMKQLFAANGTKGMMSQPMDIGKLMGSGVKKFKATDFADRLRNLVKKPNPGKNKK